MEHLKAAGEEPELSEGVSTEEGPFGEPLLWQMTNTSSM